MNVGPLADLSDAQIQAITTQAAKSAKLDAEFKQSDLEFVARMAIAATGGHLAVSDLFFFECHRNVAQIEPKKVPKWKQKCDDARGTRRNVMMAADGLLRVRDDTGRFVPLVPASISKTVNGTGDLVAWMSQNMPRFLHERMIEAMISAPAPPPKVVVGGRRARTSVNP